MTGSGSSPTWPTALFNAFEQGGTGVTRRFGGLGLGLAITKALVEMHAGTVSAHSEGKGRGSTFTVRAAAERRLGSPGRGRAACPDGSRRNRAGPAGRRSRG